MMGVAHSELPTRAHVDELLCFLQFFEVPDGKFVERWEGGPQPDGTSTFPHPVYSLRVREFFQLAAKSCWIHHGHDPGAARAMIMDDAAIERAGFPEVRSMLAYCVRGERFCNGHWEAILRSGQMAKLLCRVQELRQTLD